MKGASKIDKEWLSSRGFRKARNQDEWRFGHGTCGRCTLAPYFRVAARPGDSGWSAAITVEFARTAEEAAIRRWKPYGLKALSEEEADKLVGGWRTVDAGSGTGASAEAAVWAAMRQAIVLASILDGCSGEYFGLHNLDGRLNHPPRD